MRLPASAALVSLWLLAALALPTPARAGAASAAAAASDTLAVRFEVDLRDEVAAGRFDPARDAVGLRGAVPPLSWQRSLALQPLGEGRWGVTVRFARADAAQPVPHKFRIERAGQGADEGWEPGRNHAVALAAGADDVRVLRRFGAPAVPLPARLTGTVRLLEAVPSRHVLPRPAWVWLPPGYDEAGPRHYPVLYLLDGQNVFEAGEAGAEWQVDETAQALVGSGAIAPLIVVAVPSTRDRLDEYGPTAVLLGAARSGDSGPGNAPRRVGGRADAHARFLLDELKPLVDARFRTRPEAAHTAVGGSSMGGLFALWLALNQPGRVGAALVVSPSLWWDDGLALREVRRWSTPTAGAPRPRLWLGMGGEEGAGALPAARSLHAALREHGWSDDTLRYLETPRGRHDELSWAAQVADMLKFLQPAGRGH